MKKPSIDYQKQSKVMIKQQHLQEAQDNFGLCANKSYYSESQLSSLQLLIEDLENELKGMQVGDTRQVRYEL
jgi:hypothetical protein